MKTLLLPVKSFFVLLLKSYIYHLFSRLDLFAPTKFLMDIVLDIYHRYKVQPVSPKLLENIEGITEMNIPYSRFTEKKPLGISGVARLKNADDFLEKVVEGHLVLCDEIILVDNMSEDKTKEICLNLQRKYPNKIKFFEYQYEVFPPIYNDNAKMQAEENSIHSLAYYYNWSFSKATYKYVMKLDDDNLLVEERAKELRNFVLTKQPQKYITYRGVNIFKRKKEIGVIGHHKYIGRCGDHGIYLVGEKTYFIQAPKREVFIHNLPYYRFGFLFLHLKYLKKNYGYTNNKTDLAKNMKEKMKKCKLLPIEKEVRCNVEWKNIFTCIGK